MPPKTLLLNIELENGLCHIKAYASGKYPAVSIRVEKDGNVLFSETAPLSPVDIYDGSFETDLTELTGCTISIRDASGNVLVSYTQKPEEPEPTP